jgi:hypothetical protein
MQNLICRERTIVSLEDLAYFTALLGVPAKSLRCFRSARRGHNLRIEESCVFDNHDPLNLRRRPNKSIPPKAASKTRVVAATNLASWAPVLIFGSKLNRRVLHPELNQIAQKVPEYACIDSRFAGASRPG